MTDKTILLVEDDPDDVALFLRAMRRSGMSHEVPVARSAEEARTYLAESRTLPAAMVLDLKLPRVGGLEFLAEIRADARLCHLPVVILTSSTEEKDMTESYRLGANSYLQKPVDSAAFALTVQTLVRYWAELNQAAPDTPPVGTAPAPWQDRP